jgi:hypothetical protein
MVDCIQTWRKKLRLQELVDIVKNELESGTEISKIYEILDKAMSFRWKLVNSTRKLYLEDVKKILANQFALVM